MANILDYLDWRGDLTLRESPFNEVDNLLLAELSFLDMTGIVPDVGRHAPVPLGQAVDAWFDARKGEKLSMGVLVSHEILEMSRKMARTPRFREMGLSCCRSRLDLERETQFAAITISLGDGTVYLSFRGTDDTLVGWKEDFNMTFSPIVPSQELAAAYTRSAAARWRGKGLRLGGHSKGGNLAVYSAIHAPAGVQKRIRQVYNNDGPGFKESVSELPGYQAVRDRIITIVPTSSVVGMLLEHTDAYHVVHSTEQGVNQHNGFSWQVLGTSFCRAEERSREGIVNERAIKGFLAGLDDAQREKFVDAMFEVLGSTNALTLTELDGDRLGSLTAMLRTYKDLDRESRQMLGEAVKTLLRASGESLIEELGERSQQLRSRFSGKNEGKE